MRIIYFLLTSICLLLSSSCAPWLASWTAKERGALIRAGNESEETIEASISVPLNPYNYLDGHFGLYYFVEKAWTGPSRKTVLFIVGGPGEFVTPKSSENTFPHFLVRSGYNVVFFHLRGTGLSQIPPQAEYDKFLTTAFAVEDIEEIRQDLVRRKLLNDEGKWNAIIAWSYGTVLAQQYTFAHENSVDKLILFAPLSRHNVASAGRQLRDQTQNILRDNLEKIYSPPMIHDHQTPDPRRKEFFDLKEDEKKNIFYELFGGIDERGMFKSGVIERTESAFGSMNFVIDHYSDLRKKGELHRYKLQQFSCSFFSKLYRLRFVGWIGRQDMLLEQADIGAKIRKEMDPTNVGKDDCSNSESSSDRVFYAMGTLDGINIRFLREWLANGRRDVRDALRRSAGDAHVKRGVNEYIEKLGISDEHMVDSSSTVDLPPRRTEWDPARHKHRRPTLILKGEADPVTVGGQAEYFHFQALLGPRMLIKFPGVGHEFDLPDTAFKKGLDGIIKLEAKRFSPGQVAEVKGAINGLKLNPHLKLRLLPPHDLEPGLRLVGVGRVAGKAPNGSEDDIVALIQNTSGKEVPASKRVWKIENEFFTGKVEISPGRLAAGQTKPAYGKIIDPRQNEAYQVRVKASNNWDVNLKPLCTRDKQGVTEVMILNQKNISTEGKIGRLTIYNDYSSTDSVYIPFSQSSDSDIITFGPNQDIYKKLELPHEAKWQTDHEDLAACLPNAHDLSKVLAQEAHCDLPLVVQHSPKSGSRKEQQWTIDSPTFTATISSRLESCMPDGNPYIVKGSAKLILKDWIEIREPSLSPSQGDFELLGYNILDGDQISLILKNPPDSFNVKSVGEKGRDWFYELSNRNKKFLQPCHPFFDDPFPARNCLIFSYLVMDPLQFINVDRNEILQDIMQRFDAEHGVVHFCPLFGGIRIPGLRDPNQIFTCE